MKAGPNRTHTEQFKEAAVKQVLEGGRKASQVARSLEISEQVLGTWVGRARRGESLTKRVVGQPVTDLQAENTRLKQENAKLRMEKEILKKAAAYFAKESM